jgi:hypothetical protein
MGEIVNETNDLERGNQENIAISPDEKNNFFSRIFYRFKKKENVDEIKITTDENIEKKDNNGNHIYEENVAISPDGSVVATFNPCKL